PRRQAKFVLRRSLLACGGSAAAAASHRSDRPEVFTVLYLAHCTREKGLFDTAAGIILANQELARKRAPISLRLLVTGNFVTAEEKNEFARLLALPEANGLVQYMGFVSGTQKDQLLREADLFCFPTYYQNENQPVNLIEAMAYGLPILTTRWRS